MIIIGVDYHPSVQQIAWLDTGTGECGERRLMHSEGEPERRFLLAAVLQVLLVAQLQALKIFSELHLNQESDCIPSEYSETPS